MLRCTFVGGSHAGCSHLSTEGLPLAPTRSPNVFRVSFSRSMTARIRLGQFVTFFIASLQSRISYAFVNSPALAISFHSWPSQRKGGLGLRPVPKQFWHSPGDTPSKYSGQAEGLVPLDGLFVSVSAKSIHDLQHQSHCLILCFPSFLYGVETSPSITEINLDLSIGGSRGISSRQMSLQ